MSESDPKGRSSPVLRRSPHVPLLLKLRSGAHGDEPNCTFFRDLPCYFASEFGIWGSERQARARSSLGDLLRHRLELGAQPTLRGVRIQALVPARDNVEIRD
jgi:hypothetical protein